MDELTPKEKREQKIFIGVAGVLMVVCISFGAFELIRAKLNEKNRRSEVQIQIVELKQQ